ncbi:probable disease resistance protein RPP1, partial [Raphanus sativus]|uniref:Probable disease resistance protein RPP1 n=1 Tax=Raphanus sativus TaxID=3726 RepID=A0A9W3CK58_RAPSA
MDLYLLLVTVSSPRKQSNCFFSFIIIISPPSPQSSLPIHDVFPSFHGADVRKSFLSHLLKEFRSKAINLFIDNDITRGEFIGPELKRYASSSWCLDELVEIMKCKEELGQTVMPVFYEVDPSDVKEAGREFGKVFKKLVKVNQMRESDAKMIEDVATEVANKLFNSTPSRDFDEFIGMEAHMNKISRVLRTDLDEVRMIGIWGPAGIGKTTIARSMYTPPVCSDDHNVKLLLQQKFLSQLLNQKEEDFKISHLGVARERLNDKKKQWPKKLGGLVMEVGLSLQTQDRKILKAHGITDIYEVNLRQIVRLFRCFCMYAFGQKSPEDGFEKLVREVTRLAGKLPLGLR